MHWTENYVINCGEGGFIEFIHEPSGTRLLVTQHVSMETLNGLMLEFDTFGTIRDNWREWWAEQTNPGPEA